MPRCLRWAARSKGWAWMLAWTGVRLALFRIKTETDLMPDGLSLMLFIFTLYWVRRQFLKKERKKKTASTKRQGKLGSSRNEHTNLCYNPMARILGLTCLNSSSKETQLKKHRKRVIRESSLQGEDHLKVKESRSCWLPQGHGYGWCIS